MRLHHLRTNSHPDVFARLWEANVARLEEGEDINPEDEEQQETGDSATRASTGPKRSGTVDVESSHPSTEPFASQGPPITPPFPLSSLLPPHLPSTMTVYISSPRRDFAYSHRHRAYIWHGAPVSQDDMVAFFSGVDLRVEMAWGEVGGLCFSYGWGDGGRWICFDDCDDNDGRDGDRDGFGPMARIGWEGFQGDLRRAAEEGVRVWRMKVFVVGKMEGRGKGRGG